MEIDDSISNYYFSPYSSFNTTFYRGFIITYPDNNKQYIDNTTTVTFNNAVIILKLINNKRKAEIDVSRILGNLEELYINFLPESYGIVDVVLTEIRGTIRITGSDPPNLELYDQGITPEYRTNILKLPGVNFNDLTIYKDDTYIYINDTTTYGQLILRNIHGIELDDALLLVISDGTYLSKSQADDYNYKNKLPVHYYIFEVTPQSDICFIAGVLVKTDQGNIKIENIIPGKHTIRKKRIKELTVTRNTGKHLVLFSQDCLGRNIPCKDTVSSELHIIYYNSMGISAINFVDKTHGVYKIPYNNELLYNILMDKHEMIKVNGMYVETLDPNHRTALLYNHIRNMDTYERNKFVNIMNKIHDYRILFYN